MQSLAIALAAIFGVSAAVIPVLVGYTLQHHSSHRSSTTAVSQEVDERFHSKHRVLEAA